MCLLERKEIKKMKKFIFMYLRHADPGIRVVKLTVENPALQHINILQKIIVAVLY
jgi:hypothetical protein